jgi:hypothetical protein
MMEMFAPVLLALLFILFGLSQRGRSTGGCAGCTGAGECQGKGTSGCEASGQENEASDDRS